MPVGVLHSQPLFPTFSICVSLSHGLGTLIYKMDHTCKNGSQLGKFVTLGEKGQTCKMAHSWKNRSHLQKWVTLAKMGQPCKNGSQLGKWITLGEMGQTCKNGSQLEKWVTLAQKAHTRGYSIFQILIVISIKVFITLNHLNLQILSLYFNYNFYVLNGHPLGKILSFKHIQNKLFSSS